MPSTADFACISAQLLSKIESSQHEEGRNTAHDGTRNLWLEKEGYRVLRFWNNDITKNIDGVMEAVYAALHLSGEPVPLKHRRRRRRGLSHFPTPARDARRPSPCRGG